MNIFTFEPFGYDGCIVRVEADLRKGIPAMDLLGLSDGTVKETKGRIRSAIANSGLGFPEGRVLVSLSPADLRKESPHMDLAVACGILAAKEDVGTAGGDVLVIGELDLSGNVRPVRAVYAALNTALSRGISRAVVPEQNLSEAAQVRGMKVAGAGSLRDAMDALRDPSRFAGGKQDEEPESPSVSFRNGDAEAACRDMEFPKKLIRAIELAVAGKHGLAVTGRPGCGKTLAIQSLVTLLSPELTWEESRSTTRIWSIAGLLTPDRESVRTPPFRMPHQTATVEGTFGGGTGCRPGETSLAHNGFLFLDEATEFRSSVLQMLRVPLESGTMAISRAGRTAVYPARFQLLMAASPCPCGNYGTKDRICLCSESAVALHRRKLGIPLDVNGAITCAIDGTEEKELVDIAGLREHVRNAFGIQRRHGTYNGQLTAQELARRFRADKEAGEILASYMEENSVTERTADAIRKLALTIANTECRETIATEDIREAVSYSKPFHQEL